MTKEIRNPYQHRTGRISYFQNKVISCLEKLGAKGIYTGHDSPGVAFVLEGKPFQFTCYN